jgi:hypothetical protein
VTDIGTLVKGVTKTMQLKIWFAKAPYYNRPNLISLTLSCQVEPILGNISPFSGRNSLLLIFRAEAKGLKPGSCSEMAAGNLVTTQAPRIGLMATLYAGDQNWASCPASPPFSALKLRVSQLRRIQNRLSAGHISLKRLQKPSIRLLMGLPITLGFWLLVDLAQAAPMLPHLAILRLSTKSEVSQTWC